MASEKQMVVKTLRRAAKPLATDRFYRGCCFAIKTAASAQGWTRPLEDHPACDAFKAWMRPQEGRYRFEMLSNWRRTHRLWWSRLLRGRASMFREDKNGYNSEMARVRAVAVQ